MNLSLSSLLVVFVATVTTHSATAQELNAAALAGKGKISMCIGCHGIKGYQASFPEVYKVPMISGQGEKYIVSALTAYRNGDRKHPTMRGVAQSLNDQDMADVAAFYHASGALGAAAEPGRPADADGKALDLVTKGGCLACHGGGFNRPIDPAYPKVAGQHADYLFVALKSYKTDGNSTWGRSNPIMGAIAKQFTNAELKLLATYVHSLPGDLRTVPQAKFK